MSYEKGQSSNHSSRKSYCSGLDTIELLESMRAMPPLHYRFEVVSFTKVSELLKNMNIDHFESTKFRAGGYQWKLIVYPNGKESENGDGHISLYLKLVDQLTCPKVILATIKLFVYDHLQNTYITIHYARGKRFDHTNTQWGIPQFMDLITFKDPDNGFLSNDSCVFGVEVLVPGEEDKIMASLSPVTSPIQGSLYDNNDSYVWKVDDFQILGEDSIVSPVFRLWGYKWKLKMLPRGNKPPKGKSFSLYFGPADPSAIELFAKFELSLKDNYSTHIIHTASSWFCEESPYCGFRDFVSLDHPKGLPVGDICYCTITIEVKILEMFVLKDM